MEKNRKLRVDGSAFSKTALFLENIFTFTDGRVYCTLHLHFVFFLACRRRGLVIPHDKRLGDHKTFSLCMFLHIQLQRRKLTLPSSWRSTCSVHVQNFLIFVIEFLDIVPQLSQQLTSLNR